MVYTLQRVSQFEVTLTPGSLFAKEELTELLRKIERTWLLFTGWSVSVFFERVMWSDILLLPNK